MPRLADLAHPATPDAPPRVLLIAELGVNHDGRLDRALALVDAARYAGAGAVKLQLFDPDRLLSADAKLAAYQAGSAGDPVELLSRLTLAPDQIARVRDAARAAGLAFILTPFSPGDAAALAELAPDAVKLASPDAVNTPLADAVLPLGLPVIASTGTCEPDELAPLAGRLTQHDAGGALLQCVSAYPTPPEHAALGGIAALAEAFGLPVGYSDHTTLEVTGALAVAAGACILEKHLTHDPAAPGPDHAASLDAEGFARYAAAAREAAAMLGPRAKRTQPVEADVKAVSRQSVCAARDLPAGRRLTPDDLTVKRPGDGIPAAELPHLLGRTLATPVAANHLLRPEHLAPADQPPSLPGRD